MSTTFSEISLVFESQSPFFSCPPPPTFPDIYMLTLSLRLWFYIVPPSRFSAPPPPPLLINNAQPLVRKNALHTKLLSTDLKVRTNLYSTIMQCTVKFYSITFIWSTQYRFNLQVRATMHIYITWNFHVPYCMLLNAICIFFICTANVES